MDQKKALRLFTEGAFLVLLDVPEGTEFGIDWNSWTTGPNFKGVKMIPPGVHFVFYCAISKYDGTPAPRTGFFHSFKPQEIMLKSWNSDTEELIENKDENKIGKIRLDLKSLDQFLAAYPYDALEKWVSMSNNITSDLLIKLSPENGIIYSVLDLFPNKSVADVSKNAQTTLVCSNKDEDGLPCMKANPKSVIHFTSIPNRWYPVGATPTEISKHSLDSSYILSELLKSYNEPYDILGELQYAFVCFILGQVFDAFETWKKLLHVLCSCEVGLQDNIQLYTALIGVLYHQINEIPKDFFVDIVTSNNFLVSTLSVLFSSIEQSCYDVELQKRAKLFRKFLTKKLKWKFKSEPDDWAPVVVEL